MPWERCFGGATDGIRQERYICISPFSLIRDFQSESSDFFMYIIMFKTCKLMYKPQHILPLRRGLSCSGKGKLNVQVNRPRQENRFELDLY